MVIQSDSKTCNSNLFRFVSSLTLPSEPRPIYLSSPLFVPRNTASKIAQVIEVFGIITFPEKVTDTHQPFCEAFYSFSQILPSPVMSRKPLEVSRFDSSYRYRCSLRTADVLELNSTDSLHLSVQESITNYKHVAVLRAEILSCLAFQFSLEFAEKEGKVVTSRRCDG